MGGNSQWSKLILFERDLSLGLVCCERHIFTPNREKKRGTNRRNQRKPEDFSCLFQKHYFFLLYLPPPHLPEPKMLYETNTKKKMEETWLDYGLCVCAQNT